MMSSTDISPTQSRKWESDIIKLERVGLRYPRGAEVLKDVDLSLKAGSFTFVTGISGAGKSTLLQLINLNLRPSRGLVHLFGHDTSALPQKELLVLKRRIGMVLQDFRLIDHLSVFENVCLPLRVTGAVREDYKQDVLELLHWVGLGRRIQALPATLSGGEKQRAAIARAVLAKPHILIADEPTGNVDSQISQRLLRLFIELNRLGTTIIIATHDPNLIHSHTADVVKIEKGYLHKGIGS